MRKFAVTVAVVAMAAVGLAPVVTAAAATTTSAHGPVWCCSPVKP